MKRYFLLTALTLTSCISGASHSRDLHSEDDRQMTIGIVQREISVGMSQASVAEALGSPNIVTKDEQGDETWVYDKIATEASYSRSRGGVSAAAAGGGTPGSSLILGILTGDYSRSAGAFASSQRTLTVVIHFSNVSRVKNFSYHTSRF